jgi:YidC/Oxa1 family membrane protein insertase
MQKKNLVLFILVSALIVGGWWWVQFYVLDQPKPPTDDQAKSQAKTEPKKDAETPKKAKEQPDQPPPLTPEQLRQYQAALRFGFAHKEEQHAVLEKTLGDPNNPDYYILATITTRGGGIRNLTLPKFQRADENGRPVFDNGTKVPLQLIQDDPVIASFLMFHYPAPAKEEPVATLGMNIWKVEEHTTGPNECRLKLSYDQLPDYPNLKIVRTYTLKPKEYHIGLTVEIIDERDPNGPSKEPRDFRYQLAGSHGLPIEGWWYTSVFRTPMIGILNTRGTLERDLDQTQHSISVKEGGDRVPLLQLEGNMIQYAGVATQYFASLIVTDDQQVPGMNPADVIGYCRPTLESEEVQGIIKSIDLKDPSRPLLKLLTKAGDEWIFQMLPRTRDQIEAHKLGPKAEVFVSYYRDFDGNRIATGIRAGSVRHRQFDDITVRTVSEVLKLQPNKRIVHKYLLYHGPSKVRLLSQLEVADGLVDRYVDTLHLNTLTDYHSAGFFGEVANKIYWTDILILTTRFMHWLLSRLHLLVPNYGVTIVLLTVLVRGSMFPISRRTAQLSIKMQALAPEMRKLQEKYKDDPQAKTAAMMELYRKHGVNPLGSCLPMLLQMPFFLGLYYCLQESIHFRLASFLYIDNLAAPDMLLYWTNNIPMISDPDNMSGSFFSFLYLGPYFNILPVLAVTLMLVQQKMMTPPPADEQQEMQQKMMKYMFIFIGIMFYKVAAGLAIYFIASSLWGLAERKLLPKKPGTPATPGAAPAGGGGGGAAGGRGGSGGGPSRGKGKPGKGPKEKKPDTPMQRVKDWWAEVLRSAQKK